MERCIFDARHARNKRTGSRVCIKSPALVHCNFLTGLDNALRDQFLCGIQDESKRVELFELSSLIFDTAYKGTIARESAMKNAAGANKSLQYTNHKNENFAIELQGNYTLPRQARFHNQHDKAQETHKDFEIDQLGKPLMFQRICECPVFRLMLKSRN